MCWYRVRWYDKKVAKSAFPNYKNLCFSCIRLNNKHLVPRLSIFLTHFFSQFFNQNSGTMVTFFVKLSIKGEKISHFWSQHFPQSFFSHIFFSTKLFLSKCLLLKTFFLISFLNSFLTFFSSHIFFSHFFP